MYASLSLSGGLGKQTKQQGAGWNWELDGNGQIGVYGVSVEGQGVLSNTGVGACAQLPIIGDEGFKHFWKSGETDFNGCDFSGLHTVEGLGGATAAAVGRTVALPAGLAREEFAVVGATAPPDVTLTGPGGVELSTPTTPNKIVRTRYTLALAVTDSKTTYFIVARPHAGRWTLTPSAAAGAVAPVRYETAGPLAPLDIKTHVTGTGLHRKLHWTYHSQSGVGVTFTQTGGTREEIAKTTRGSGETQFEVAPGVGGKRHIVADVSIGGFPRQVLTVGSFRAVAPKPPRVTHARYRLRARKLTVSWAGVRHARSYLVHIALSSGVSNYLLNGSARRASFKLKRNSHIRAITVAVSVGAFKGSPVKASGPPKRHKHKHKHKHKKRR